MASTEQSSIPRRGRWAALTVVAACCGAVGCLPVAPYQRAFLNGVDMELAAPKPQTFESNVEAYREGAAGANGGKIGGGCGCS